MAEDRAGRLDWVDVGRGIAIALVVLLHSARWFDSVGWDHFNDFVVSLRMPLFFSISGMLAATALQGPWSVLWSKRLSLYLWVFAIFEVIGVLVFFTGFVIRGTRHSYLEPVRGILEAPYRPIFELWFIWALALFVVVTRLCRRVDARLQLVVAAGVSVVALGDDFDLGNRGWNGSLMYYFFFLCGVHGGPVLLRLARRSAWVRMATVAGWLAASTVVTLLGLTAIPGVSFLLSCAGILAGVSLASLLVGARPLRRVGTQTLPIYLGHTPIIILVSAVVVRLLGADAVHTVNPVLVPVAAVGALLLARRIHQWVAGTPLRYLYRQPDWLRDLRPPTRWSHLTPRASMLGPMRADDDA